MFLSANRLTGPDPPAPPARRTQAGILGTAVVVLFACPAGGLLRAAEPPTIRPFGPRPTAAIDACPGSIELSDKTIVQGMISLTRDHRLKIHDNSLGRQREIPLRVIRKIECAVKKEWLEKEWRFRENANDAKVFTGRSYPVREYLYTITLRDGRKIRGAISAILYLQKGAGEKRLRFLLHKRQKGKIGTPLKSLIHVQCVVLDETGSNPTRPEESKRHEEN